ncbi:hypothetical protein TNCT_244841 [Trichonephila clavata]|uniref:Uncharacterized protein n=1 Tax=Trichonephila clavata TaxID=2740835 RepID=A0A8X6I3A5_TRICU|nr:hypothetical protein TNCT_244841 [Trichonephila clavata]
MCLSELRTYDYFNSGWLLWASIPRITLCTCNRRDELQAGIAGNEILLTNYQQLISVPDTESNQHLKEVVRNSIKETMQDKDAMAFELESLPHVTTLIAMSIENL